MKISVVINTYNYAGYLRECLDSVLNQTRLPDEIVLVDDGSTDNSAALLKEHYGQNPLIRIITQLNGGQTMAIGVGVENATGDILCLLDADDRYKPHYLETIEKLYREKPEIDMTFCRFEPFGEGRFLDNDEIIWLSPKTDYAYGYTALLCYFRGTTWIGNVTSTLSLRRRLALTLNLRDVAQRLYIPTTADYSIQLGASLLGGYKYYLHQDLVEYRHHRASAMAVMGRFAEQNVYQRWVQDQVRIEYYFQRSCINPRMKPLLEREVLSIPDPLPEHLAAYQPPPTPGLIKRAWLYLLRVIGERLLFWRQQAIEPHETKTVASSAVPPGHNQHPGKNQ